MRLLRVLSQRPGRSGSGVFLAAMVREAAERGYVQHVIVAGPPGTSAAELPPLAEDQVTPIVFPSAEAPFPLPGNSDVMPYPTTVFARMTGEQVEQYLATSRRVMTQVRERFRPDLVHAHHLWLMTALARELFDDVPLVATSHNAELRQAVKAPHLAERARPDLARIDRVCVLTPQSVQDTIDGFGVAAERIALTGAGYDHTLFSPAGAPPDPRTITWVGRLSTSKGVPFLLDAVRRLHGPWRLWLVGATGTGDNGLCMDALVRAAGERVVHLGHTQPEQDDRAEHVEGPAPAKRAKDVGEVAVKGLVAGDQHDLPAPALEPDRLPQARAPVGHRDGHVAAPLGREADLGKPHRLLDRVEDGVVPLDEERQRLGDRRQHVVAGQPLALGHQRRLEAETPEHPGRPDGVELGRVPGPAQRLAILLHDGVHPRPRLTHRQPRLPDRPPELLLDVAQGGLVGRGDEAEVLTGVGADG